MPNILVKNAGRYTIAVRNVTAKISNDPKISKIAEIKNSVEKSNVFQKSVEDSPDCSSLLVKSNLLNLSNSHSIGLFPIDPKKIAVGPNVISNVTKKKFSTSASDVNNESEDDKKQSVFKNPKLEELYNKSVATCNKISQFRDKLKFNTFTSPITNPKPVKESRPLKTLLKDTGITQEDLSRNEIFQQNKRFRPTGRMSLTEGPFQLRFPPMSPQPQSEDYQYVPYNKEYSSEQSSTEDTIQHDSPLPPPPLPNIDEPPTYYTFRRVYYPKSASSDSAVSKTTTNQPAKEDSFATESLQKLSPVQISLSIEISPNGQPKQIINLTNPHLASNEPPQLTDPSNNVLTESKTEEKKRYGSKN